MGISYASEFYNDANTGLQSAFAGVASGYAPDSGMLATLALSDIKVRAGASGISRLLDAMRSSEIGREIAESMTAEFGRRVLGHDIGGRGKIRAGAYIGQAEKTGAPDLDILKRMVFAPRNTPGAVGVRNNQSPAPGMHFTYMP